MAIAFPYTRYACPCGDLTADPLSLEQLSLLSNRENEAFNPHHPHANCSLYPLEQLLYCDECNATQCSRCWSEEVMCWYCPNCMFEVPSSGVKGDGNR
jgi:dynactin-4